jgi:hypothetical protein
MNQFTQIIDTYLSNYETYNNGKIFYECEFGELIFIKDDKNYSNILCLFGIYIFPAYRENGLCRDIFKYLIDKGATKFKYFCVQSVLSKVLYEYLLRFIYLNKKFNKKTDGFYYKL